MNVFGLLTMNVWTIMYWFLIYSILGWLAETIYTLITTRKLTKRGFLFGPMCPIYGVGALAAYFILSPFSNNYIILYFAGMLVATALEYVTAVIMGKIFGGVWWDYRNKPLNFRGILCLESSIAWGFYTLILFVFLHSRVEWFSDTALSVTPMARVPIGHILFVGFLLDFMVSLGRTYYKHKKGLLKVEQKVG